MKIVIKAKNLKLNKELKDYIEEKIGGLERFAKVFQDKNYYDGFFRKGKPRAGVWVEVERTTLHHRKGSVFRAEAQMYLLGKNIRAESEADNLKIAIVQVKDELQREIKRYRSKMEAKTKRKARIFKKLFHLSSLARFAREARRAKFKRRKGGRIREEGI